MNSVHCRTPPAVTSKSLSPVLHSSRCYGEFSMQYRIRFRYRERVTKAGRGVRHCPPHFFPLEGSLEIRTWHVPSKGSEVLPYENSTFSWLCFFFLVVPASTRVTISIQPSTVNLSEERLDDSTSHQYWRERKEYCIVSTIQRILEHAKEAILRMTPYMTDGICQPRFALGNNRQPARGNDS